MSTPESNGRKPADADTLADAAAAVANDESDDLDELDELGDESDQDWIDDEPSSSGLEIAFTPRQILGGFALLAALILLLRRRRPR
jgi:MYXO-CTERM domain-containing protein